MTATAPVVPAPRTPSEPAAGPAADRAHAEALGVLVRCWLRECGVPVPGPGPLRVELPAIGTQLTVHVTRRSPSGAHGIGAVLDAAGRPLAVPATAGLLTAEAAARHGWPSGSAATAAARICESARRAAGYAAARAGAPADPPGLPAWLAAEQGLLAGHPWHPMTKAHDGLPDEEDAAYAPEARGHVRLHWFAADPAVVTTGAAGLDALALLRGLAGPELDVPPGLVAVPAHPWQAARLATRPAAAELLDRGALVDLGPAGAPWWATSSLRTMARPDAPVMLKVSLGLRVTNSRRENKRAELHLAVRTAELLDAGLGAALAAAHPRFAIVADRAFVAVGAGDDVGLDTLLREQPFDPRDRVACAGALVDARPDRPGPVAADLVRALAARRRESVAATAAAWYRAWIRAVAEPLLWLHGHAGIGLEAHLQNVLVGLDDDGLPDRGWYRDNQGWYLAADNAAAARRWLPGVDDGVALLFDPALVTDRVVYYLGVNHLLGVAAALATAGLTTEEELLRVLRDELRAHCLRPRPSTAAELLLEAPTLPVKANLLTGVDGRDELDGDVAVQSVYVDVPNPLLEVSP